MGTQKPAQVSPFRPGVGKEPPEPYVGRQAELDAFGKLLRELHYNPRNMTLLGLRGVGKSVVSKHFLKLATDQKVVAVRREIAPSFTVQEEFEAMVLSDAETAFERLSAIHRISETARRSLPALVQVIGASLHVALSQPGLPLDVGFTLAPDPDIVTRGRPFVDRLTALYRKIGEVARDQGRGVVLVIDEAQAARCPDPRMGTLSQLLQAVSQVQEDNLPVALVLVGLPPVRQILTDASSHAERFLAGSLEVGALPPEEALVALEEPARRSGLPFEPGVAQQVAEDCQNYPYFIQAFGDGVWNFAHDAGLPSIRAEDYAASLPALRAGLDATFYGPRYGRITANIERLVLSAMGAEEGDVVARSALVQRLGGVVRANMVDRTLLALIDHDVVMREGWGQLRFTAPGYGRYLSRQHPIASELRAYRTRSRSEREVELGR